MRGATYCGYYVRVAINISIHAPHAGSDHQMSAYLLHLAISIHAPHAGSDSGHLKLS